VVGSFSEGSIAVGSRFWAPAGLLAVSVVASGCKHKQQADDPVTPSWWSPPASSAATAPKPKLAAPKGAGGFWLGASRADVQQACVGGGFQWEEKGQRPTCSGTPEAFGLPATARFKFCEDSLCIIEIIVAPQPDKSPWWGPSFEKLQAALVKRYGAADDNSLDLGDCTGRMTSCLDKPEAKATVTWLWKTGHKLMLFTHRKEPTPGISIKYFRPKPPSAGGNKPEEDETEVRAEAL
jgi:hypothetical protein